MLFKSAKIGEACSFCKKDDSDAIVIDIDRNRPNPLDRVICERCLWEKLNKIW